MRLFLTLLFLSVQFTACSAQSPVEDLTPEQWEEDIDFLMQKLRVSMKVLETPNSASIEATAAALKNELPTLDPATIMTRMGALVAAIGDGHTELNLIQRHSRLKLIPLSLYFFGEDLYVTGGDSAYAAAFGQRIVSFDNVPVSEAFDKIKLILAHDNAQEFVHQAPMTMLAPALLHSLGVAQASERVTLQLGDGSSLPVDALSMDAYQAANWKNARELNGVETPLYHRQSDRYYWHEYLPDDKIMYFKFNRVNDQKGEVSLKRYVDQMFAEIDRVRPDKLVIDLRHNNGGNYNKSKPLIKAIQQRPWLRGQQIFVINGRRTFSAATVTSIFLKRDFQAILIGENSRSKPNGSDNTEYAQLPNSGLTFSYTNRVADHWVELGDEAFVRVDVPISMTIEDYVQGRDPVLDYIRSQ